MPWQEGVRAWACEPPVNSLDGGDAHRRLCRQGGVFPGKPPVGENYPVPFLIQDSRIDNKKMYFDFSCVMRNTFREGVEASGSRNLKLKFNWSSLQGRLGGERFDPSAAEMVSLKGSIQTIDRQKGTVYRAYFDLPSDHDRNRITKSFASWKYEDPESQAEQFLLNWNYRINQGNSIHHYDLTVRQFFRAWHHKNKDDLAHKTVEKREWALKDHIFPAIGDVEIRDLTVYHIRSFYQDKLSEGKSPNTVRTFHEIVAAALKEANRSGLIDRNPAQSIQAPSDTGDSIEVLTRDQLTTFLETIRDYEDDFDPWIDISLEPAFYLAATTGMRKGEVLGVRWEDVDFENNTIMVRRSLKRTRDGIGLGDPKNRSSKRRIILTEKTVSVLKTHRHRQLEVRMASAEWHDAPTVFTTGNGRLIWPSTINRRIHKAIHDRSDLTDITFHSLRHTHATLMLQAGVHPKVVSERMGHSSIEITMDRYSHVLPTIQKEGVKTFEEKLSL